MNTQLKAEFEAILKGAAVLSFDRFYKDAVIRAMSHAYNLALDKASEAARLETACKDHTCTGCSDGCTMPVTRIYKNSILDLKIKG